MSATRGTQQTAKMKLVREEELAKQAKRNETSPKEGSSKKREKKKKIYTICGTLVKLRRVCTDACS